MVNIGHEVNWLLPLNEQLLKRHFIKKGMVFNAEGRVGFSC